MHSHFFNSQCIATIHVCHNSLYQYCGYRFTTFVICACCINSQIGDYYSGHIFGFSLIFISSSWSMYFLITSSDKITISSISSDTTAVVEGVVDNLLPKKFFKFKLWNSYFLPSSIDYLSSPHIVMAMSLVWSYKIVLCRLLILPGDWMVFFPVRNFIHPIISSILKFCALIKSTFWKCFSL